MRHRDEANLGAIAEGAGREVQRQLEGELPPGLYLVATPIGNLGDITIRALTVLARADVILCEDTRHSRTLLTHFGITGQTRPYHEHSSDRDREHVLADLEAGKRIALISDAGTPLVSDPGLKLVRACLDAGHHIEALPGASAALTALLVAGLPTDAFFFAGFLPPKSAARKARIAELKDIPATLLFYEAPSRVAETVVDLAAGLGDRFAAIARELTKLHEEVLRAPLGELAAQVGERTIKGEVVILVGPPIPVDINDADIEAALAQLLPQMSLRDAAKAVAQDLGVSRSRVYELGLRSAK
jgi:16S rRNA (cytidine1402-2'-O)-methyltransferase